MKDNSGEVIYLLVMVVTIATAQVVRPAWNVELYLNPYSSLHIN